MLDTRVKTDGYKPISFVLTSTVVLDTRVKTDGYKPMLSQSYSSLKLDTRVKTDGYKPQNTDLPECVTNGKISDH